MERGLLPFFTTLDLSNNKLEGTVSSTVFTNLTRLTSLNLRNNQLMGNLPEFSKNNAQLAIIDLGVNSFSGTLPCSLSLPGSLSALFLDYNRLTGSIPMSFGNLSSILTGLHLNDNNLNGELPSSLQYLKQLNEFSVANNIDLGGTIPAEFSRLVSLQALLLSYCSFTGLIPAGLGVLCYLVQLDVSFNYLTGTLPVDIYNASVLSYLSLPSNFLSGTISPACHQLRDLSYLALDFNLFHGSFPSGFGNANTFRLSMASNMFSGAFQVDLTNLITLAMLRLQYNHFTGDLDFMSPSPNLMTYFNISNNYFHGNLSRVVNMGLLVVLDVSNNLISGSVPSITQLIQNEYFFAQSNLLEGSVSNILNATNDMISLRFVDLSNNRLSGPLPDPINGELIPNLLSFAAIQNCFTGTIPESFCHLGRLQVLALDGLSTDKSCRSSIFGSISSKQTDSYVLSQKTIHGTIPKCLFSMPQLQTLHLSGNSLEGSIPLDEDGDLGPYLSDLSLSHNRLMGSLPRLLKGGNRWKMLDVSYNKLKGELSDNEGGGNGGSPFKSNSSIYLNINRLSGHIPDFYYEISAPGDLDMLKGNLFSCSTVNMRSHLPSSDPYHEEYDCGSDSLNTALLVWVGLIFFIVGLAYYLYSYVWRNQAKKEAKQMFQSEAVEYCSCSCNIGTNLREQMKDWNRLLAQWQEEGKEAWKSELSNQCQRHERSSSQEGAVDKVLDDSLLSSIFNAGCLLHSIRMISFWITVYAVCLGSLVYGLLTVFFGSYDEEYAWTISTVYLSGIQSAAVLLVYFVGILYLLCFLLASKHRDMAALFESESTQAMKGIGNEHRESVHEEEEEVIVSSDHNAKPTSQEKESVVNWKSILILKVVIAIVDIAIVMVVNGFYVYISLQIRRWSAVLLSVALSLFKVVWGLVVQMWLTEYLQPLQQLRSEGGLHEVNVSFMSGLMLFNTIMAPCLAAMIASSDCSYDVFAPRNKITASYSFKRCTLFDVYGCEGYDTATNVITFVPPFSYTYQCSSAILVDYAYVFAYKYVVLGILYPLFIASTVLSDCRPKEGMRNKTSSASNNGVQFDLLFRASLLPSLWRLPGDASLSYTSQQSEDRLNNVDGCDEGKQSSADPIVGDIRSPLLSADDNDSFSAKSLISSLPTSSASPPVVLFSAGEYAVRVIMMLSCLLTFGVALPYLAVLIGFSIASNTYLIQLGWLRQLKSSSVMQHNRHSMVDEMFAGLCHQCQRLLHCIKLAFPPLLLFLPFFFAYFLFDMAGDEGGWIVGLWFALALLVAFILVCFGLTRWQQSGHPPLWKTSLLLTSVRVDMTTTGEDEQTSYAEDSTMLVTSSNNDVRVGSIERTVAML
eukprot:scaffold6591_cov328-Ochromonas_danica.AAC.12